MRTAFCSTLVMTLVCAAPALADDACVQALLSGRVPPGVTPGALAVIKHYQHSIKVSQEIMARQNDLKGTLALIKEYMGGTPANRQALDDMMGRVIDRVEKEELEQNWYEGSIDAIAKGECMNIAPPPPVAQQPPPGGYGTSAVLEMSGEPVSDAPWAPWTVVAPGQIEQHTARYAAVYGWTPTLPRHIGPEGFDLTLTAHADCNGERISTGLSLNGGFDFVKSAADRTPVPHEIAAYCESGSDEHSITVHVKPQSYAAGQDVTLQLGAFYGPKVTYHYRVVRPGQ